MLAGAVPAAAQTVAQTATVPTVDLTAAQKQLRENAAAVAKVPLERSVEPAFSFRV